MHASPQSVDEFEKLIISLGDKERQNLEAALQNVRPSSLKNEGSYSPLKYY